MKIIERPVTGQKINSLIFILILLLLPLAHINAEKGCCSYHDGVCGNKCCDGSFLSTDCKDSYSNKKPANEKDIDTYVGYIFYGLFGGYITFLLCVYLYGLICRKISKNFNKNMENSKKCPKCKSCRIKEVDSPEDFLHHKPEGEPARKSEPKTKQKYSCHDCNYEWEEDIE